MGKYALLIGVDTYGEGLQPLPAASKDVAALREVLLDSQMGGFDEVKLLINPMQPKMAREIELWFQDRQLEDLVLLFFSGHGVKDDRRDLYFAATNTEKQRDRLVRATAIPARFLHDSIRGCKAKSQVLILDCCFSGAFGDLVARDDGEIPLQEQLGAEGRVVLTSTSAVDYSFEEKGADLSIYTRYLVEGIATGAADEDGDGAITIDELHRYAGRKVKETSPTMSPTLITLKDEGFRIQVARSPQDDPKLKYRKEAEHLARAVEFTIPAKQLLIDLRAELGLSDAEADEIESEVLKPHRKYQAKWQKYQNILYQCLKKEPTLRQHTINDLKRYRACLQLKPEDIAAIEQEALSGNNLDGYVAELEGRLLPEAKGGDGNTDDIKLKPPDVSYKQLQECDPSKILFIKNVRDPHGGWAYSLDHIQKMDGSAESRVFELFWLPSSKGAKSASKGDLMLLNQQAKITHIVEMLDDDVRENSAGYFRWVRVVWMPEEANWSKLPHQREVIGFEPPTIGGGTAYSLRNLSKLKEKWNSLKAFQQHVFQMLIGAKSFTNEIADVNVAVHTPSSLPASNQGLQRFDLDVDDLSSDRLGADYYAKLRELLVAQEWEAADQETADRMFEVMKRQKEGWLQVKDINNFPSLDLRNIDRLWVKYSQGKFGFSVQKEIYLKCGATLDGKYPGDRIWFEFCDRVGWLKSHNTSGSSISGNVSYDFLVFDDLSSSPAGQLPWKIVVRRRALWGLGGDFMGCLLWRNCSLLVD